ncbi:hypothetical protein VDF76_21135, partial [Xanthomonas campestris pv. raphani]|uniref:hypothetical protein n=1 Tax=Xanthomonas campestris TaxID=339 RepID=UPI002B22CE1B
LHVQSPRGRELDSKLRRYSKLGGRRSPADAAVTSNIAKNTAENNYLSHPQREEKVRELQACGSEQCREKIEKKWDDMSLAQSREMKDRYFSALTPDQQSQLLNLKPGTKEYDAILAQGVMQSGSKASPGLASIYNNNFQLLTETDWQGWKANNLIGGMSLEDSNRLDTAILGIFGSPGSLTAKFGGTPEQVAAANRFGNSLFDMPGVVEVFGPRITRTLKDPSTETPATPNQAPIATSGDSKSREASVTTPVGRPTPQQSEADVGQDLGIGARAQVSFKNGVEVPYGTADSVRPDWCVGTTCSVEVKNYNIATNRSKLVSSVSEQALQRSKDLPSGMQQLIVIDVRGQNVTNAQKNSVIKAIVKKSNGIISPTDIKFKQ